MRLLCYNPFDTNTFDDVASILSKMLHFELWSHHCTVHPTRSEFNRDSKESSLISKLTVLGCSRTGLRGTSVSGTLKEWMSRSKSEKHLVMVQLMPGGTATSRDFPVSRVKEPDSDRVTELPHSSPLIRER